MSIVLDRRLIAEHDKIVVAVSGGIDSMVLLDLLASLRGRRKLELVIAHVDHQKRKSSAADAAFVADRAAAYGIPFEMTGLDPDGEGNFHERARNARYAFFRDVARRYGANKIALAHQADDQAETILMRLVRGAAFAGYAGIPERSAKDGIELVRPLLFVSRRQIAAYQAERGLPFRDDETNDQDHYTRNRFRHRLMPEIAAENPRYLSKFAQFAAYAGEANDVVSRLAEDFMRQSVGILPGRIVFSANAFSPLEPAVKKETVKRCYDRLTGDAGELSYGQILASLRIIAFSKPHGSYDLPSGHRVEKNYDEIAFFRRMPSATPYAVAIPAFGEYPLPDGSMIAVRRKPDEFDVNHIELCYNSLDFIFPMTVRTREKGDRIIFAYGTKKLSDLFIDRKIPMEERNRMPLVIGKTGEVVWIPEMKIRAAVPSGRESLYVSYIRENDRHA